MTTTDDLDEPYLQAGHEHGMRIEPCYDCTGPLWVINHERFEDVGYADQDQTTEHECPERIEVFGSHAGTVDVAWDNGYAIVGAGSADYDHARLSADDLYELAMALLDSAAQVGHEPAAAALDAIEPEEG